MAPSLDGLLRSVPSLCTLLYNPPCRPPTDDALAPTAANVLPEPSKKAYIR